MKYVLKGSASIDQEDLILSDMEIEIYNRQGNIVHVIELDEIQIEGGQEFEMEWEQETPLPHRTGDI